MSWLASLCRSSSAARPARHGVIDREILDELEFHIEMRSFRQLGVRECRPMRPGGMP